MPDSVLAAGQQGCHTLALVKARLAAILFDTQHLLAHVCQMVRRQSLIAPFDAIPGSLSFH